METAHFARTPLLFLALLGSLRMILGELLHQSVPLSPRIALDHQFSGPDAVP